MEIVLGKIHGGYVCDGVFPLKHLRGLVQLDSVRKCAEGSVCDLHKRLVVGVRVVPGPFGGNSVTFLLAGASGSQRKSNDIECLFHHISKQSAT